MHDRETGGLRLNTERYNLLEIMISGQNRPGERHGNKYISTSPGDRMKLVYFADKHNEFGRKLEIHMEDKICGIETISHMQFYNGVQAVRCWTDVKNVGTEPQGLEYVSSFALTGIEKEGMLSTDDKMRVWYPHNGWQREMQWESYTFPQLGLARVDVAQGKFQDAMTKMKQAEELNSSLWTTYQGIGDMLVQLGQPQQAALNYVRAIALADGQAMPLESLFRLASANYPAVKAGLEEAQKKANNSVAMPLLMGNVAFQTGHYADASQALNQVLTREQGRQPGVYSLLAECLLAQGRAAEGVDYANRAVKISPNAHNLAILARTLRGAGNYTEALDAAQKALKASATDADALTEEAFAYIGLKDYDKALASLQKLIAADPDNIYALVLAGSVQDKLKNSATPSVYYSRALSAPARTPAEVALKGLAQLKTGKTLDGDATLRKLIENPAPEACYWAAVAYVNSGDGARGAALARQARDLGYQNAYLLDVASGPITLRP